ncbi:MAG: Flp pilus assembly complex ATPase component TadA [Candidatus Omnitrophica bacterium]|nr:Flp pilus assembly complex ATPase component TadA [Candidatus Omnitrophota bacterium]
MFKKSDKVLYDGILKKHLVSKDILNVVVKESEETAKSFQELILEKGLASEDDVLDILCEKLRLSRTNIRDLPVNQNVLAKVPVKIAMYYKFLPVKLEEGVLTIASAFPLEIKTQDEIRTQLGFDINLTLSPLVDVLEGIKKHYGLAADTLGRISSKETAKTQARENIRDDVEDIEKLAEDASVIRLVNQIILDGWKKRATDIHLEPFRGSVSLRYRVDGILYEANVPSDIRNFLSAIISRIKIMSNLDIVERRLPQDGRAVVKVQEQVLDLRISTIPTPFGESVVIRILPTKMLFDLTKLGLSKRDLQILEGLIQKPHGILFVTGPTGSGKTTTLYACLSRINTKERKIITIEDPIEYEMSGIIQMQVLRDIGLDFAHGLRNILRHDPDVIMVGEVRDLETAEIAIRVALTGHLIFSTIHTNDAASAITRLVDIGVEAYLVASSVEAFIAQRLIRLICPDCRYEDKKTTVEEKQLIAEELGLSVENVKIFRGKGCPACNYTGFFGRTAIYEILMVDEDIKELILKKIPSVQIKKLAVSKGMQTLRQDGLQKVIAGVTTPEEVMKVAPADKESKNPSSKSGLTDYGTKRGPSFEDTSIDSRAYSRLDSKVNISYKVFESEEELSKKGFTPEQLSVTKNISAGGMLFVSREPIKTGSIVELRLELPDGKKPVECLAKVVRVEEREPNLSYDIAVCFLDITGSSRVRLDKFVASEREYG